MISVEEALSIVLDNVEVLPAEQVGCLDALGRVLAEDAISDIDVAPFDNTSMDGFALQASDTASASAETPCALDIVAHIGAGDTYDGTVASGQAARIMTGARMPEGADAVVKVEDVTTSGEGGVGEQVFITAPLASGTNVRCAGEEVRSGQAILSVGDVVTAAGVGLLATCGHAEVSVYQRPRVGVMSIGNELVDVSTKPEPGKIRDSNSYALAAEVKRLGIEPIRYTTVPDDPEALQTAYKRAVAECDVIVSSGGACGGDFDYSADAAVTLGETKFDRVNMKPGKAQSFTVGDGFLIFGLSGNPAAAMQGFRALVRPALLKMMGHTDLELTHIRARLTADVNKKDPRRFYMMATLEQDADGVPVVTAQSKQSSALLGTQNASNCLLLFPEDCTALAAGDLVDCYLI